MATDLLLLWHQDKDIEDTTAFMTYPDSGCLSNTYLIIVFYNLQFQGTIDALERPPVGTRCQPLLVQDLVVGFSVCLTPSCSALSMYSSITSSCPQKQWESWCISQHMP